jgi:HAD superfamily hydrolase (TIGR01549 family)
MIKAIIFDAYGTLISTGNGSLGATRKILDQLNVLIDPVDFYRDWKLVHKNHIENIIKFQSEKDIFIRDLYVLFEKYSINEKPENVVSFMIDSLTGRKVFSDTKDVLSLLSHHSICIGSTSDTEPLLENIRENKLDIDYIFSSQSLRIYKPRKEFYEKILFSLDLTSKETVFVGDSLVDDVMGPQQIDIYSIWLNRLNIANDTNIIPDVEIASLYDLPKILNNFKN